MNNRLSPHKQCQNLRTNDRSLEGFTQVLGVIEFSPKLAGREIFVINQRYDIILAPKQNLYCIDDWTEHENNLCTGCVGALMAWFFDTPDRTSLKGIAAMRKQTGLTADELRDELIEIMETIGKYGRYDERLKALRNKQLFNGGAWPVSFYETFKVLSQNHPGK